MAPLRVAAAHRPPRNPIRPAVLLAAGVGFFLSGAALAQDPPVRSATPPVVNLAPPQDARVPLPPRVLPDGRVQLALIDFGPPGQPAAYRVAFGTVRRNESWGWHGGMVRQITRRLADSGPYLCDFVEGEDASFAMAVEPVDSLYHITLHLGDPDMRRGPVDLVVNGAIVAGGLVTEPRESKAISFDIRPDENGWLTFRLTAADCGSWAVQGADVWGPKGARFTRLFPDLDPRGAVPPPDSLNARKRAEAPEILRAYCDYLVRWRPSEGGFSYAGAWYQSSYPVRTLLAGAAILDEPSYRELAFEILDRFCDEQRPGGGWYSSYFGRAGCPLAALPDTNSSNLADIGSFSLCLALAAPEADSARAARYLAAARRYADQVVLPVQSPEGWFPNLLYMGRDWDHPYSVATATQATSLAALGAVTGEERYLEAAERAGVWLAGTFRPDGRVNFSPHDTSRVQVMEPTAFGNLFYLVEALIWTEHYARDRESRTRIHGAIRNYLWGTGGLQANASQGYWFQPRELWNDSKMGGVLYLLGRYEQGRRDPALTQWIDRSLSWLGDPGLAPRIGVMAPPSSLTGEYALPATGFAGIGVADLARPGILMPPPPEVPGEKLPLAPRHRPR